jgi:tetratricopeptide (TPR) repeat protein
MTLDQNDPRLRAAVDAYNRGDLKEEAALLEPLLQEHPDDANLLQRVGAAVAQLGELKKAEGYLKRALEHGPKNVQVLQMLAWIAGKSGNREEARSYVENIIALDPKVAEAHVDLGNFQLAEGDVAAARASFEKALAIEPTSVRALVEYALLCEREHSFEEGLPLAERAVALAPDHGQANVALGRIEFRMGKAQQAIERMQSLLARKPLGNFDAGSALYLIGQAVETTGDYDHAFVAFQSANNAFHELYAPAVASMDSVLAPAYLKKLHDFFEAEDVSAWTKLENAEEPTPVFLVGFPRSGTTLLDQILKTHSAVNTLEEKENLIDVRNELVKPDGGLETLRAMTDDDVNRYRKRYWARVRKDFGGDLSDGVLIDKMPLNTILLGLIYRLFPEAKIIFALRDPRDAVLSCYQQRFNINVAMYQLLKLDTAAAYYDQVMKIGDVCRDRLPLAIHTVRYEDVIGDMQAAATGVLEFLGLNWEEQILDYREQARTRWITTPSAEQVIEPLHSSSIGKWRNYETHMKPVLPMLEPWVEKFGYEPS